MTEELRIKVIEKFIIVQYLQKSVTIEILSMEKEKSKGQATDAVPCRKTINFSFKKKVGGKEGVDAIPENITRPQGTKWKMVGLPARKCMS